jgi:phosphoglycerate dehydrogenase-like enzyme
MPQILILSKQADNYYKLLEAANLPELELVSTPAISEAVSSGAGCEIVFGEPSLIREVLPALKNLRWVQSTWAGVEPLLDPSLRRDYILTNARGIFGGLMSEYVFGYLLFYERRILQNYRTQLEHHWEAAMTGTLRGKSIGLLGVGSIGSHLARTAKHFGMIVRGYTRVSESCSDVDMYFHGEEILTFADGLDYLVNVLPNTSETHHIVDASVLEALPPRATFINVGRGSAVDETALIAALKSKQIAGAVLDVFEQEPLPKDSPLWELPNVYITYHTSALTVPADMVARFTENYNRFVQGETLNDIVDFDLGY